MSTTDRVRELAATLREAERPVRVLSRISWLLSVRDAFFAAGARELPVVHYTPLAPTATLELTDRVTRAASGDSAVDLWLRRQARTIASAARMLAAVGTPAFHDWSRELYGDPRDPGRGRSASGAARASPTSTSTATSWSAPASPSRRSSTRAGCSAAATCAPARRSPRTSCTSTGCCAYDLVKVRAHYDRLLADAPVVANLHTPAA